MRERVSRRAATVVWGLLGVTGFSFTLPVTRYAVPAFGPELVGPGRALIAAVLGAILLVVLRRPLLPPIRLLPSVLVVALGSVIGFPLLVAHALKSVSASHAAVTIALLPAATAVMAVLRARERPQWMFWLWCAVGTALVAGYLVVKAETSFGAGDLELFGAVLLCALGYAEGGVLSRTYPGWVVTCWSLIIGSPLVIAVVLAVGLPKHMTFTTSTVLAFGYLAIGSSLLAFFAWYRALALGGIAKVGQIQLLQPILTMVLAALLLGEPLDPVMMGLGLLVGLSVLMAQRTRVAGAATADQPRDSERDEHIQR
jgi:drug/metabolite transporter (DMT)-like permease